MQNDPGAVAAIGAGKEPAGLIAPIWHTVLVVLLIGTASIAGARGAKNFTPSRPSSNLLNYLASIVLELALAGVVLWGLHLRRTSLRLVFGRKSGGAKEWLTDAGAALAFWIVALIMLGSLAALLQIVHLHPEKIQTTVSKMAPTSVFELMAWTGLSITAGICEEFIFRGYLQLQLTRLGHRIWIGVLGSALVFGFAHGYEGLSGMLLIVAFGALFSVFRLIRGNLRAGMIAHAWHDFFSGMVLWFLAHHKLFPQKM